MPDKTGLSMQLGLDCICDKGYVQKTTGNMIQCDLDQFS